MARHNARITTLDWLTVFEIDHLIFTWRRITGASEFRQAVSLHEELHKYGCASWEAKDRNDREGALEQFNKVYEVYGRFQKALGGLRRVIKSTGDTAETNIKIFSM